VREAVLHLVHQGAREVKRSRYNAGPALDWSRMDFSSRQAAMRGVLADALSSRGKVEPPGVVLPVAGKRILFLPSAFPPR
jgi:hypothetical protein